MIHPITFSTLSEKRDNRPVIVGDLAPGQFVEQLVLRTRKDAVTKDGPAFMVTTFKGEPLRKNEEVATVTALVLDCDQGEPFKAIQAHLDALKLFYVAYPTFYNQKVKNSGKAAEEPARDRYRVVVSLSESVPAAEYGEWYPRAADFAVGPGNWDPGAKDAARLHYLPVYPVGAAGGIIAEIGEGRRALDPWRDVPPPYPEEPKADSRQSGGAVTLKPWQAYNAAHGLEELVEVLEDNGYHTRVPDGRTGGYRLTRPGQEASKGRSVSIWPGDWRGAIVKVFSSSCEPLREGQVYNAFGLLVELKHGGNVKAATQDARTWLDANGIPYSGNDESLKTASSKSQLTRLSLKTFGSDFQPERLTFLVEPYFPKGRALVFDADGGTGKTSFMLALAASLSRGVNPLTGESVEPVRTLYLHRSEDSNEALEEVYRANDGRQGYITFCDDSRLFFDEAGCNALREVILEGGFGLVVTDALFYFFPAGEVREANHAMHVLPVMERINRLVRDTGVCWVDVRHTSKGRSGKSPSEYGLGSGQIKNSHRGQLLARFHPLDQSLVVVTDEKGSLLIRRGKPFGFRREGNRIVITHEFSMEAFEQKPPSKLDEAKQFLLINLSDGPIASERIEQLAMEAGIAMATVRRAKTALGIVAEPNNEGSGRGAKGWRWQLPEIE
ncbi:MAG: AAA family ATPase [Fimbriimonadaceae bacterium]|nr:AAA family ATPase [Fimbriimonadaceae bacterium]